MNAVITDVEALVKKELEAANERFPLFNSAHEGYGVLWEEIRELKDEIKDIKKDKKILKDGIIKNSTELSLMAVKYIKAHAVNAAIEAIQVAAMCEKYEMSIIEDGKPKADNIPQNADKVYCKDCDYFNTSEAKPLCCHGRMSTNGLDDWCYHGKKRVD